MTDPLHIKNKYRIFKYRNDQGIIEPGIIEIKIEDSDTFETVKSKLIKKLGTLVIDEPTLTQDIFFSSTDDENLRINTIEALRSSTGTIVFTIAESLGGGRRRRSSTPRKTSSSRRRRSTKRRTTSRKQQKRRRATRSRAH